MQTGQRAPPIAQGSAVQLKGPLATPVRSKAIVSQDFPRPRPTRSHFPAQAPLKEGQQGGLKVADGLLQPVSGHLAIQYFEAADPRGGTS